VFHEDSVCGMRKPKFPNLYVKMGGFGSWAVVGTSDFWLSPPLSRTTWYRSKRRTRVSVGGRRRQSSA